MQYSSVVSDYLDNISYRLRFDPALSERVREEIEDYFCETISENESSTDPEFERQAITRLGRAEDLAAEFALTSLISQRKILGRLTVFSVAACFIVMKARVVWFIPMIHGEMGAPPVFGATVGTIDRYAFLLALAVGTASWLATYGDVTTGGFGANLRQRLRLPFFLGGGAAAALIVSVVSEALVTALRLSLVPWSPSVFPLVLAVIAEIGLASFLLFRLRRTLRCAALVLPLIAKGMRRVV